MSRSFVQLTYEIEALAALHVGTGYGLAGIADATTARHLDAGQPRAVVIPGSSVKGRARYHLELLGPSLRPAPALAGFAFGPGHRDRPCRGQQVCPVCNIFGSTAHEGILSFSDAHLAAEADLAPMVDVRDQQAQEKVRRLYESQIRTNVMLSRRRGVAKAQHLFSTEVAAQGLWFEGTIHGYLPSQGRTLDVAGEPAPYDLALLCLALRAITHIGGRKSRGLGGCRFQVVRLELDGAEPVWTPRQLLQALQQEVNG